MATVKQLNRAFSKILAESQEITTPYIIKHFSEPFKKLTSNQDNFEITVAFLEPNSIRGTEDTISVALRRNDTDEAQSLIRNIIRLIKLAFHAKYRQYKQIEIIDEDARKEDQIIVRLAYNKTSIESIITLYGIDSLDNETEIGAVSIRKSIKS